MAEPPGRPAPLIRFEGVTKSFGAARAVAGVDLDIAQGEFFCLLGPSGCGKTTLMRTLAGFETPDSGRILLDGADLAGVPAHRRPVNMMFQSYALFPHMSVEANIAFGLRQDGVPRAEIAERVAAIVRTVQIQGLEKRRPHQLSGGQKQRVALARALVKRPLVLLLDEPLAALDRKLREDTRFELKELQARLGLTFLMVTHDQDEAMAMADRIGVMEKGRLVQVGAPAEVYETPATRGVAAFVGDSTLIEGVAGAFDGAAARLRVRAALGASSPEFVVAAREAPAEGSAVTLALRPEKLRLWTEPPEAGTPNVLEAEVWDLGYLGDKTLVRLRLPGGGTVRVSRLNASRRPEAGLSAHQRAWIGFDPADAVLLTR
ncbi:ABC transporter ATP-binding protein [Alsobacter sp. SYSU M60028]|uniref:Spermidine/putrescine import ATP-binding protein PotA n=1 Tax=Alsobacter ponti TaxID=2962936 RepID=A0ABT1LAM9_9HYPH|nr:ABC transporter ATP-binding protein [Alsobacter ponti]MCP8938530.1 ABC transporter ATP-binding protein [Alsobacter ponti]